MEYPDLKTEIKGFWTDTDLYLLFVCPYRTLNVFLPPQNDKERDKLWDKDVVEMFLGDDWENIRHYREYEIAPTADWVDLAIDLDHRGQGEAWQSGWKLTARIDEKAKIWYAACQIPLKSVSEGCHAGHAMARESLPDRWRWPRSSAPFHVLAAHLCREARFQSRPRDFGTLIFGK